MKKIFAIFALILAMFCCANPVPAEDVVIFGNDYKIPKIYREGTEAKGILVDILRHIDERMGKHTFKIRLYPWARAYKEAADGQGGIVGLSKTEERLKIFDYSGPVYCDEVVIVVLKGKEFPFEKIGDLKGKKVGIGLGGSFGDEYEMAKQSGLFEARHDSGPVFRLRMLLANRIDCALLSPGIFAFNQTLAQDRELLENKEKFSILPVPLTCDPNFLGFSKKMGMTVFLEEFDAVLKEAVESGAVRDIVENYSK